MFLTAAKATSVVMFLVAAALVSAWLITVADLPGQVTALLEPFMDNKILLMFAIMVLVVIVGTAMDMTPTILILTPVLMPVIKEAGIDPIYFGVLFIINNSIGLITPPVGTVLNVVAGVAQISMDDLIKGVWPFMLAELIVLALLVAFPALVTRPGIVDAVGAQHESSTDTNGHTVMQLVGRVIGDRGLVLRLCWQAQAQAPAVVVNAVELSGDGAIAGNNFKNGVLLAFKEINAAGGILGRQIEVVTLDIQTKPEVAKAAVRKAAALQAFAMMGPVFSDIVAGGHGRHPQRTSCRPSPVARPPASPQQGNPYLFRTSLSQAASMPKLARYMKDVLRVESVAMVWVDNAFGRGGKEAMTEGAGGAGHQDRGRSQDRAGAGATSPRSRPRSAPRVRAPRSSISTSEESGRLPAGAVRRGL